MSEVFLEIGGNLGNRLVLINQTKELIRTQIGEILSESSIYETPAWGFEAENNFYNQVLRVNTNLSPDELLKKTQDIENQQGRVRGEKRYMSRTMDIDILFFDNKIIETTSLEIPHPRIQERNFVLVPLNEIDKSFVHPKLNKTIAELLNLCADNSECKKIE